MSEITQARRERGLQNRKRAISVDGNLGISPWVRESETNEQDQSSFFSILPVEIRLQIYKLVLCDEEEKNVDAKEQEKMWDERDWFSFRATPSCPVGMLRTCRKLYREAIDILYSGNHLSFASSERFVVFTRSIPRPRIASIRRITIAYIGKDKTPLSDTETYRCNCENEDFLLFLPASKSPTANASWQGNLAKFGAQLKLIQAAQASGVDVSRAASPSMLLHWVAIILLLDELPRNCFRGLQVWITYTISDKLALDIGLGTIKCGVPQHPQVQFFVAYSFWLYMPMEHSEVMEI
ncbi:tetratricopeptide-like helical [Stemphylium lycopersici]|uniref:Tetratricopeptide-like helical n=1 Tax=Stemphylium lycopersici TaxID=183478 RepID=A0A364N7K7_STELY|nr:tetratricopeptide-like helical [Stemphylium lycopersici]